MGCTWKSKNDSQFPGDASCKIVVEKPLRTKRFSAAGRELGDASEAAGQLRHCRWLRTAQILKKYLLGKPLPIFGREYGREANLLETLLPLRHNRCISNARQAKHPLIALNLFARSQRLMKVVG